VKSSNFSVSYYQLTATVLVKSSNFSVSYYQLTATVLVKTPKLELFTRTVAVSW
jgi:hypothetical protein